MKNIKLIVISVVLLLFVIAVAFVSCDNSSTGLFQDIIESEPPDSTKYQIIAYVDRFTGTAFITADNTKLIAYTSSGPYVLLSSDEMHDVFPVLSKSYDLRGFIFSDSQGKAYYDFESNNINSLSEGDAWKMISTRPIKNTDDEILWQSKVDATYYCISSPDEATLKAGILQPEHRPLEDDTAYWFHFSATEIGQQFLISDPENLDPESREYLIMSYHYQTGSTTTYLPQAYLVNYNNEDGTPYLDEINIGFGSYSITPEVLAVSVETTANNVYYGTEKTEYSISNWTAITAMTDGTNVAIVSKNSGYSFTGVIATLDSGVEVLTSISDGWASKVRTGKVRDIWNVRDENGITRYLIIATEDIGVYTSTMPDSLTDLRTGGSCEKGVVIFK